MWNRLKGGIVAAIALLALPACPGQQIIANAPTVEDADDQQSTCKVAKDPLNPLVVEWPGTAKVDLETVSRRGLVAVSYSGCVMKILSGCEVKGGYTLEQTTPARDRLEISDNNELYAKLPLGAASLKGELALGSSLELDYIAVGQRIADDAPTETVGECGGATHYVRTITVGAFQLDAKVKGKAGLSVEVGSAGAGIGRTEGVRKLRSQGDVGGCANDPASPDCGAILQLGLSPLRIVGGGRLTSGGFGRGLDPISEVYQVEALGDIEVGSTSLQAADVSFLKLLQTAKRADREDEIGASTKAKAWDALARYEGTGPNPWKDRATKRAEEWTIVAEQEERQREALLKLKSRFLADKAKLDELLELDDDVVSADQKEAYKKEFVEVYGVRKKELALIGLRIKVSNTGAVETDSSTAGKSTTPGDTTTPPEGENKLEKGLAGFGFFSIELEAGLFFSNSPNVSIGGRNTVFVKEPPEGFDPSTQELGDLAGTDGVAHAPLLMLGVMLATPELLPGGFGFYGSFRGLAGGSAPDDSTAQSYLSGSGGIRWDPRITPNGTLNIGAGGGYFFTPGTAFYRTCVVPPAGEGSHADQAIESCEGVSEGDGTVYQDIPLGGPMVDIFAGVGFSNRLFMASFRTWFQAAFLSNDAVEIDGPLLTGGFGGQVGIVL